MLLPTIYQASAPGSFMLAGEHAVLHSHTALVSSIQQRIKVSLQPRCDQQVIIRSDQFPHLSFKINDIEQQSSYEYILAVLKYHHIEQGCEIHIESEFSSIVGLGSSAAVLVSSLAVVNSWIGVHQKEHDNQENLLKQAREILQKLKGVGSGADLAASIYGGLLHYSMEQQVITQFNVKLPLHLVYAGYKTPTDQVIRWVEQHWQGKTNELSDLFKEIQQCTDRMRLAIEQNDLISLGIEMNKHHALQVKLGVSDANIEQLRNKILTFPGVLGCKISGSGLGDCVVALGDLPKTDKMHHISMQQGFEGINVNVI